MTRTNTNFEGFSWLYSIDTALGQYAPVEECVAIAIGQLDETKSLFRAEPLDHPMDRRPGGSLHGCSVEPGSGAESTWLGMVGISVELATPRMTEILMSQLGFLKGNARLVRDDGARRPACGYQWDRSLVDGDAKRVARVTAH
jgi:hypothetical protein